MTSGASRLVDWDYWLNDHIDHDLVWTRSNVKDQCPRPITPLSQQLFKYEHDGCMVVLRDVFGLVPPGTDWDPMVATFYGQLFAPVEGNIKVGEVLPGTNPHEHLEQFFGLERDPNWIRPLPAVISEAELEAQRVFAARLIEFLPTMPQAIEEQLARIRAARPTGDLEKVRNDRLAAWLVALQGLAGESFAMLIRCAMLGGAMFAMTGATLAAHGVTSSSLLNSLHADVGDNESAEMARAVQRLAATAVADPAEFEAVKRNPSGSGGEATGATPFLVEWTEFLSRFGHRGPGELAVENPSWRSDPTTLVAAVDLAGRSSNQGDRTAASVRRDAEAELIEALGGDLPADVTTALERSRFAMGRRESGKSPIALVFDEMRRIVDIGGRRLAAEGLVRRPGDLLFLRFAELEQLLLGGSGPDEPEIDMRMAQFQRCLALELPEIVMSSADGQLRSVEPSYFEALGFLPPRPPSVGNDVLSGVAGSAGVVTGVARVMSGPWDEFEPGEILIAHTVDPGWSPILACAVAIVLDLGGTMSHGVVVARELGIPCVVNVRVATTTIKDGSRIRVDGNVGVVDVNPS